VRELERKSIETISKKLTGLKQLCEEFSFSKFSTKLSKFCPPSEASQEHEQKIVNPLSGIRNAQLITSFLFVENGSVIESDITEASALFPLVGEQLLVDGCARKFFMKDNGIASAGIHPLQIILSDESLSNVKSQIFQSCLFDKQTLEDLFLGCSKSDNQKNLSNLSKQKQIEFESGNLSFEVLDSLLLNESISVESEGALLEFILKLGPNYRDLLRHIQLEFLSESCISLFESHFEIPAESLCQ
jgi:hypothetical protein